MSRNRLRSAFNTRQYMLSRDFELFYYSDLHFHTLDLHTHDYYEFYFYEEGDVSIEIEGQSYPLKTGTIILIPPGIAHHVIIHDPEVHYRRFVFWVSEEYCHSLTALSPDYIYLMQRAVTSRDYLYHLEPIAFNHVKSRLLSLLEEINSDRFGKSARIPLLVNDIIIELGRTIYEMENPEPVRDTERLYENIIAFIETHLDEDLSLDRLAEEFYVSKFHISHLFQDSLGIPIHQYIIKKRLTAARAAFLSGMSIGESVSLCGFQDYSAFYRAFRKEYGMSPARCQELYQVRQT